MFSQQSGFLRVCFFGIWSKIEPEKVIVQMFSRNAIEAINKAFQATMIGIYTPLRCLEAKKILAKVLE